MVRCDMHVHSRYSARPANWIAKRFGCPESFTEPDYIFETATKRGMTHVTITDHNNIDGCLEIMGHPNTFLSCEVTARFPEDQCKIHILVYDISERQYREIMAIRKNIYDLADYLVLQNIFHVVAHPMHSINNKLNQQHFEKLLIMFNIFELNGSASDEVNTTLIFLLQNMTAKRLEGLADKYDLEGRTDPAAKGFVAGSDDHSGTVLAETYTENPADCISGMFGNYRANTWFGAGSTPHDLAYRLYSIVYQYMNGKLELERYISRDVSIKVIDSFLNSRHNDNGGLMSAFLGTLRSMRVRKNGKEKMAESVIAKALCRASGISKKDDMQTVSQRWFNLVATASNESCKELLDCMYHNLAEGRIFDLFRGIGSLSSLYFLLAPYYIAYHIFQETKNFSQKLNLLPELNSLKNKEIKVAHFTDTFYEVSGVVTTLRKMMESARLYEKELTMVTCSQNGSIMGEKVFCPVQSYDLPEYPELKLNCPPVLEIINYCYECDFSHIHAATPGPLGLVALLVARILQKPFYSTYHTAFPQYVGKLVDSPFFEDLTWKYMRWFYGQADLIFVPSKAIADELSGKGFDEKRLCLMPRGVDTERFSPAPMPRTDNDDYIRLLYVGRISKEKNLDILAESIRLLEKDNVHLTVVGDGPYSSEMKAALHGCPVDFRGYLYGDELVDAYRQADLFVFPSTTDTFGNVVLEAHACGKPVIVTDVGGPQENVIHSKTGFIVKGNDTMALVEGIRNCLNRRFLQEMGDYARRCVKERKFDKAFLELWEMYR